MLEQVPGTKAVTVSGDKGFDTRDFVKQCRRIGVVPHRRRTMRGLVAAPSTPAPHGILARHQPEKEEADRRMLRLVEDRCLAAEGTPSRGVQSALDLYSRLRGLQPGAHAQPGWGSFGGLSHGLSYVFSSIE